jgi:hypothetical protein
MITRRRKLKYYEKNPFQYHSVSHKFHVDIPGLELGSPQ